MAFPPQRREPATALPSIIVPGSSDHFRADHDSPYSRSSARTIPGVETRHYAPPPLPPPRMPFDNPPPHEDMSPDRRAFPPSYSSYASGYGSAASTLADERARHGRRNPNDAQDEGYASWSVSKRSRDTFPPEFGVHHNRFQFQSPADIHGTSMKNMLNPLRSVEKSPPGSLLSVSANPSLPRRLHPESHYPELSAHQPLPLPPLPIRSLDAPARLIENPPYSAISPRSAPFQNKLADYRTSTEPYDIDRSPRTRKSRNNSDDASSTQGGYDYELADGMELEEASDLKRDLKRFHLHDGYVAAGQKRRAASPPSDHSVPGQPHLIRRSDTSSRGSPVPRLAKPAQGAPMPPLSRSNSYMSGISITPSSATTNVSYDRRSPGHSPGGVSPISATSPLTNSASLNPSPRGSISSRTPAHARNESSSRNKLESKQSGGSKMQLFHMCECCPKKPKKFETAEELQAHEAEKQYNCSYCGNRFKNKNEAERHQNSLHVRRHSWSCSALSVYDRAFHESTASPGEADTCGYCGDDFYRSGMGPSGKFATDQDWDERGRHLQDVHKFGECNIAKKFFRADHFRQHLKHSHAGASGKWTNMLENACMIEEEQPAPQWVPA